MTVLSSADPLLLHSFTPEKQAVHLAGLSLSFNSFMEVRFLYYTIHPLTMYEFLGFGMFIDSSDPSL